MTRDEAKREIKRLTDEIRRCDQLYYVEAAPDILDHEYDADAQTVAQNLLAELTNESEVLEDVGYRAGARYVMRMTARRQEPDANLRQTERPVWLVTGGRRGVTAELAYALGTQFDATLCLVGSSDPEIAHVEEALALDAEGLKELKKQITREALAAGQKPIEAWSRFERALETRKTLKRFQDANIAVESYNCDLTDFSAARALTQRVLAKHGRIDGVLFGAGFEKATLFEKCALDAIMKIVDVKVASAVAILSAFDANNYPKTLVGMGSISGRMGSSGQVGYCIANNMLAKTLAAFAHGRKDCRALGINWHMWDGVGMAVRPESRLVFESSGLPLMPMEEGVKVFVDEITGARRPVEICQTHAGYFHWYAENPYPYFTDAGLAPIRASVSEPRAAQTCAESARESRSEAHDAPTRALITLDEYKRGNSCAATLGDAPELADPLDRLGRFVPRLIETEPPTYDATRDAWQALYENEYVLILGACELADALAAKLNDCGVPNYILDNAEPKVYSEADADAVESKTYDALKKRSERLATIIDLSGWTRQARQFTEETVNATTRGPILFDTVALKPIVLVARPAGVFPRYNHLVATRFGGDFGLYQG